MKKVLLSGFIKIVDILVNIDNTDIVLAESAFSPVRELYAPLRTARNT